MKFFFDLLRKFSAILFAMVLVYLSLQFPPPNGSGEVMTNLPPPRHIEHFSFGYNMAVGDSLWLRGLQDIDHCELKIDADTCTGKGWLFQIFDAITELDPQFYTAHEVGGLALSVLIRDIPGATVIFDKAVGRFPDRKGLFLKAGYNALYEEKNLEKAAGLYEHAAQLGAPPWTHSLAVSLYAKSGDVGRATEIYESLKDANLPNDILERIEKKIKETKPHE